MNRLPHPSRACWRRPPAIDPADADLLLAHALGRSRTWLLAHGDDGIAAAEAARFTALVERRAAGEPWPT